MKQPEDQYWPNWRHSALHNKFQVAACLIPFLLETQLHRQTANPLQNLDLRKYTFRNGLINQL